MSPHEPKPWFKSDLRVGMAQKQKQLPRFFFDEASSGRHSRIFAIIGITFCSAILRQFVLDFTSNIK